MKELRVTVTIDRDGGIVAEAHGFEGRGCLEELDKLLDGQAGLVRDVRKKPEFEARVRATGNTVVELGRSR